MTRKPPAKPKPKPNRKPAALAALQRASRQAVKLARQTNTPAWVLEGDKLVDVTKRNGKPAKGNGG